jgi:glyoxylase-like metal-dependent hydrolase (beta-lactamase superfamily II)
MQNVWTLLEIGRYSLHAVPSGEFGLDGGAMFGVVPRPLWERTNPPDELGRIPLGLRLLLIRGPERTWLVDTGIGEKFDAKSNRIYKVDATLPDEAVRRAGFDPASITDVLLTHLHFDHAGGSTRADGTAVFENARYHVQRRQWEWAREPSAKDRASFRPDDFVPLMEQDRLVLLDGRTEVADGIEAIPVDGHTPAMQLVKVSDGARTVLYGADLVPTRSHVRTPYVMAYDNEPLKTVAEKTEWLGRAAAEDWVLFLEHDPVTAACRVRRGAKDFEAADV